MGRAHEALKHYQCEYIQSAKPKRAIEEYKVEFDRREPDWAHKAILAKDPRFIRSQPFL